MAMFKWGGMYINPQDVAAIYTNRDSSQGHPFYMTVHLRNGKEFRTNYHDEGARDIDAAKLARWVDNMQPDPITRVEIEDLLDRLKGAIRRDIKALREDFVKDITGEA